MNLAHSFQNTLEDFLDDIDNADAEALANSECTSCDGTGFTSWEEHHPYGMGFATETLWEVCSCVYDNAAPYVLAKMAAKFTIEELDNTIALLVKMKDGAR